MNKNQLLVVIFVALFGISLGDYTTYTVEYSGSTCTICGVTNFDYCTVGNNASAYYYDTLPQGSIVQQVSVTTTAMYWCETNAYLNWYIGSSEIINGMTNDYNCVCGSCPQTVTYTSSFYSNGLSGYSVGGYNYLTVANIQGSGSVGVAVITLGITYTSGGNTGNNATAMVKYTGCGFCDLCGSNVYSLSNGLTDCGEGTWDDGFQYFNDPAPRGSTVTQIAVLTTAAFWCSGPTQANFTVNGMLVGVSDVINHECECGSCPPAQTIQSEVYSNGFPGYQYGNSNSIQVMTMSGDIGIGQLSVVVTFTENGSEESKSVIANL